MLTDEDRKYIEAWERLDEAAQAMTKAVPNTVGSVFATEAEAKNANELFRQIRAGFVGVHADRNAAERRG
jgi:hypothetical protein